jgi:hypothetical protein
MNPGAYPKAHVDVNLSSDDDIVTTWKPNASAGQKAPAGDDVGDDGSSSA